MLQSKIAMDRLKERIARSQKMYVVLMRARIRSMFHPNGRVKFKHSANNK